MTDLLIDVFTQYHVIDSNTDCVTDEYSATVFFQRKPKDQAILMGLKLNVSD
jgi:hypothetical protein